MMWMKNPAFAGIWILFSLVGVGLQAQPASDYPVETYGLDPLLYNGRIYSYHIPSGTAGTPYYHGASFVDGTVTLRGVKYTDLPLKYDVINQQLILQYQLREGGVQQLILSEAWLENFTIGNTYFEMIPVRDTIRQIAQVIGTGPRRIVNTWTKELKLDSRLGSRSYVFTKAKKRAYLQTGQTCREFLKNKSFIVLFEERHQPEVRKYLQRHHLNLKKANDTALTELIHFCNTSLPE